MTDREPMVMRWVSRDKHGKVDIPWTIVVHLVGLFMAVCAFVVVVAVPALALWEIFIRLWSLLG